MNQLFSLIEGSLGALLMVSFGVLAIITSHIVLTVVAARVRWYWGLLCLTVPFGWVVFSLLNWQEAKRPAIFAATCTAAAVSIFVVRSFLVVFFGPNGSL